MNPAPKKSRSPAVVLALIALVSGGWFALSKMGALDRGVAALRENEVVMTGKPVFLSSDASGCPEARLETSTGVRIFSWPQREFPAGGVKPDQDYAFTFLEPSIFSSGSPVLIKVSLNGQTLYDASICPIHRETMNRTIVPLASTTVTEIANTLFPNSGHANPCPKSSSATVWVCESCRRERDKWLEKCRQSGSAKL